MDRAELRDVAERWMRFWRGGDLAGFLDLHDATFVDRSAAGRPPDRAAFKDGVADLYRAFPDFAAAVEALVIDEVDGSVAIRWTATGTHRGPFMGEAPSGALVRFGGIEIIGCRNGKVVSRWGEWDGADVLGQIRRGGRAEG